MLQTDLEDAPRMQMRCLLREEGWRQQRLEDLRRECQSHVRPSSLDPTPASGTISCEAQQLSYAMENRYEDGIDLRSKTHGSGTTNT